MPTERLSCSSFECLAFMTTQHGHKKVIMSKELTSCCKPVLPLQTSITFPLQPWPVEKKQTKKLDCQEHSLWCSLELPYLYFLRYHIAYPRLYSCVSYMPITYSSAVNSHGVAHHFLGLWRHCLSGNLVQSQGSRVSQQFLLTGTSLILWATDRCPGWGFPACTLAESVKHTDKSRFKGRRKLWYKIQSWKSRFQTTMMPMLRDYRK